MQLEQMSKEQLIDLVQLQEAALKGEQARYESLAASLAAQPVTDAGVPHRHLAAIRKHVGNAAYLEHYFTVVWALIDDLQARAAQAQPVAQLPQCQCFTEQQEAYCILQRKCQGKAVAYSAGSSIGAQPVADAALPVGAVVAALGEAEPIYETPTMWQYRVAEVRAALAAQTAAPGVEYQKGFSDGAKLIETVIGERDAARAQLVRQTAAPGVRADFQDAKGRHWRFGLRAEDAKCDVDAYGRNIVAEAMIEKGDSVSIDTGTRLRYFKSATDTVLRPIFAAPQPVDGAAGVKPVGYMPRYVTERLDAGDSGVMCTITAKPLPGHGVDVGVYTAPAPAAPVDLSELQLYDENDNEGGGVFKSQRGDYVKLDDVRALLAASTNPVRGQEG